MTKNEAKIKATAIIQNQIQKRKDAIAVAVGFSSDPKFTGSVSEHAIKCVDKIWGNYTPESEGA